MRLPRQAIRALLASRVVLLPMLLVGVPDLSMRHFFETRRGCDPRRLSSTQPPSSVCRRPRDIASGWLERSLDVPRGCGFPIAAASVRRLCQTPLTLQRRGRDCSARRLYAAGYNRFRPFRAPTPEPCLQRPTLALYRAPL